jgi:ribonucleoside-diphosphate reductase alpha chain
MAIAPTTSSSAILGQTSPGIEPFASNYYKAGLAKGNFMRKINIWRNFSKKKD